MLNCPICGYHTVNNYYDKCNKCHFTFDARDQSWQFVLVRNKIHYWVNSTSDITELCISDKNGACTLNDHVFSFKFNVPQNLTEANKILDKLLKLIMFK